MNKLPLPMNKPFMILDLIWALKTVIWFIFHVEERSWEGRIHHQRYLLGLPGDPDLNRLDHLAQPAVVLVCNPTSVRHSSLVATCLQTRKPPAGKLEHMEACYSGTITAFVTKIWREVQNVCNYFVPSIVVISTIFYMFFMAILDRIMAWHLMPRLLEVGHSGAMLTEIFMTASLVINVLVLAAWTTRNIKPVLKDLSGCCKTPRKTKHFWFYLYLLVCL